MDQIGRLFGPQFNGVTGINKLARSGSTNYINFNSNSVSVNHSRLNSDTLVGLAQFASTGLTAGMADDVLGEVVCFRSYNC